LGILPWMALGVIVKLLAEILAKKLVAVVVGIVG
jgi:hypothetical protein